LIGVGRPGDRPTDRMGGDPVVVFGIASCCLARRSCTFATALEVSIIPFPFSPPARLNPLSFHSHASPRSAFYRPFIVIRGYPPVPHQASNLSVPPPHQPTIVFAPENRECSRSVSTSHCPFMSPLLSTWFSLSRPPFSPDVNTPCEE
jgi:hypothetical protein